MNSPTTNNDTELQRATAYTGCGRQQDGLRVVRLPGAPPEGRAYTEPTTDGTYIKPICPSGGHGRGHRLALQNRAAARHVPLTVNSWLLVRNPSRTNHNSYVQMGCMQPVVPDSLGISVSL